MATTRLLLAAAAACASAYHREDVVASLKVGDLRPEQRVQPWLIDAETIRTHHEEDQGTYVAAQPLIVEKSGDQVLITVTIADGRSGRHDVLAVYTPYEADITRATPVRVASPVYNELQRTTAQLRLYLPNLRSTYKFVIFSSPDFYCNPDPDSHGCDDWSYFDPDVAKLDFVAQSPDPVRFDNPDEPRAARVLPGDPWKIVWTSNGDDDSPGCRFPDDQTEVPATKTTNPAYNASLLCGSPAADIGYIPPGAVHEVTLDKCVESFQEVRYECGSLKTQKFFSQKTFRCPRMITTGDIDANASTKIAIVADMGRGERDGDDSMTFHEYGSPARSTADLLASLTDLDFVWHNGDLSYANGYLSVQDDYLDMIEPFASKFPYGVGLGNHEVDWPTHPPSMTYPPVYTGYESGGECGVPSLRLYPVADTALDGVSWWSQDVGLFHVTTINTEVDFATGSPQWLWLERDLQQVDRHRTPWVVVSGHRPMYVDSNYASDANGGDGDLNVMQKLIAEVEPLLLLYQVDVFWAGHNHAYQRHCTCAAGECVDKPNLANVYRDPEATLQLVVGTGGADFTRNAQGADFALNTLYMYGIGILEAHNSTHLDYTFVDNGANGGLRSSSRPGDVLDYATLVKPPPPPVSHSHHHKKSNALAKAFSSTTLQDALIGIAVALVLLALLGFALYSYRYQLFAGSLARGRDSDADSEHLSLAGDMSSPTDRRNPLLGGDTSDGRTPLLTGVDVDAGEDEPPSDSSSQAPASVTA